MKHAEVRGGEEHKKEVVAPPHHETPHSDEHKHDEHDEDESHASIVEKLERSWTGATSLEQLGDPKFQAELVRLRDRLGKDWLSDKSANYTRINLTETFTLFDFDVRSTITHWRLAKIMDGITMCQSELNLAVVNKAEGGGFSAGRIPELIYNPVKNGKADEDDWEVTVRDPEAVGAEKTCKASLADFAHFVDVVELNKSLGVNRISLDKLAYLYFSGLSIVTEVDLSEEEYEEVLKQNPGLSEDQKKLLRTDVIDLLGQGINPRDSYLFVDVDGYVERVKDSQAGMQMMGEWRFSSEGHREVGGHAQLLDIDGGQFWAPVSGRISAHTTLGDLQKQDGKGMKGQPQELGDMDEEKSGAIIRFRLADLAQRRQGSDVRKVDKTQRLAKAMVGLTTSEDALAQTKEVDGKKHVFICGEHLTGAIIGGMQYHHDAASKRVRGRSLSKEEASDYVLLDVIAPCILNNPNDWRAAMADTFAVGKKGAQSVLQQDSFDGFVLHITCYDPETKKMVKNRPFTSFAELLEYIYSRVRLGHVDQPGAEQRIQETSKMIKTPDAKDEKESKTGNVYFFSEITKEKGEKMHSLISRLLQNLVNEETDASKDKKINLDVDECIGEYIKKGVNAEFVEIVAKNREKFIKTKKEKATTGADYGVLDAVKIPLVSVTFDTLVGEQLKKSLKKDDIGIIELVAGLCDLGTPLDDSIDVDILLSGIFESIQKLSEEQRKKIIKP